jgi:hypothetical protein
MTKKVNVEVKVPFVRTITEFDKGGKFDHITFQLKSGEVRDWDLSQVSEENARYAFVDRIRNKAIDDFAGKSSNPDFVLNSLDMMESRLQTGEWNLGRTGGFSGIVDLIQVVSEQSGESVETIQAVYDEAVETNNTARIKDWKDNADIQFRLLQKKTERAEAKAKTAEPVII